MVPSKPMRPITITATTELGTSPEEVWRFVSDTDWTNRVLGARPVEYTPIDDEAPTSARFVGKTSAGAFNLTYEELPFEWSYARELRVVRNMRGGLLESYSFAWSLAPSETMVGGTRVQVKLELWPRYRILRPAVWLEGRTTIGKLVAFAESIDAHVRTSAPSPFAAKGGQGNVNENLLGAGVATLVRQGIAPELAQRLAATIRDSADADLVRIRPFELADAWKEDRDALLRAMLHGVPAGLFDLRWAIVCPSCRTASELATSLGEVKPEGHCQLCDITFELELDRAVEATFVPHEGVRKVENQMFCIGGPARTPHVWAQTNLEPNEARPLSAPRERGRYRVFARGGASASVEVEEGAPAEARVDDRGRRRAPRGGARRPRGRDRRHQRHCAIAPREARAAWLRERRRDRALPLHGRGVPEALLERPPEARHAAQGNARRRSSSATSPARPRSTRRSATPPRSAWSTTTSTSYERRSRARRRAREDDGGRRDGCLPRSARVRPRRRRHAPCGSSRFREKSEHGALVGLKLGAVRWPLLRRHRERGARLLRPDGERRVARAAPGGGRGGGHAAGAVRSRSAKKNAASSA